MTVRCFGLDPLPWVAEHYAVLADAGAPDARRRREEPRAPAAPSDDLTPSCSSRPG